MSSPELAFEPPHARRWRASLAVAMLAHALLTAWLALARFAAVHNRTFDLALYARMAWGLMHVEAWDPIVGGNFVGGHASLVLLPLGVLGWMFGAVPVLIAVQSAAVALAAWPVARIGARRFGPAGGFAAGLAFLLYPNLGHTTTFEFHPGTVAVLPLCWALDALDRKQAKQLLWWCVAVVSCRASLALQTLMLGLLAMLAAPELRPTGKRIALYSAGYFAVWQLALVPLFGQSAASSENLHFGQWGGSPLGVLPTLFRAPGTVLSHFSAPERLTYLLRVLAPLGFLPLLRPAVLLVALPPLALNLLSQFPTATALDEHYLTFAVPPLVVAALDGLHALLARMPDPRRARPLSLAVLLLAAVAANALCGGLPWSRDFVVADITFDDWSASSRKVFALVGPSASVQAPDSLLPHFAERWLVSRVPPPEREADFVVFDVRYRQRFVHNEDLLRTVEEPLLRTWLARPDHGLVFADRNLLVLRRGQRPRSGLVTRYFLGFAPPDLGIALTDCLAVTDAELRGQVLTLQLVARKRCPGDLALHLGADHKPKRADLLFDGLLSTAQLARGDLMRSQHTLSAAERSAILQRGLNLGLLRSSGARPHHEDPISVEVPLRVVR
jgi:uncharacterized membrane protein